MYALKKHHYYAITTIIEAVSNVVLSILLAPKYGIIGVALGTAIPMLIVKVFVMPVYMSRIVGINILTYLKPFVTPCILAGFMIVLSHILGAFKLLGECKPIVFLGCGILAGLFFLVVVLVITRMINQWLTCEKRSQA
jgi:O-antigen/teichoic acid export membrane protein